MHVGKFAKALALAVFAVAAAGSIGGCSTPEDPETDGGV